MTKRFAVFQIIAWAIIAGFLLFILVYFAAGAGPSEGLFSVFSLAQRGGYQTVGDYTVPSGDVRSLSLDWRSGNATITPTDGDSVRIIEKSYYDLNDDEKLQYDCTDGLLSIRQGTPSRGFFLFWFARSTDVEIQLPEKTYEEVALQCASGNIRLASLQADSLSTELASGDVQIDDADVGSAQLNVTSGTLTGSGLSADRFECGVMSGDVRIDGSLGAVSVDCTSGNVELETDRLPDSLDVELTSGDVRIGIPENDGFYLSYSITSGDLDTDFDLLSKFGSGKKEGRATYKNGGPEYSVQLTSGDLTLSRIR